MCRALKVLCAAPGRERLLALKRAAVSVHWELVGGALSVAALAEQVEEHRPDVVVVDPGLGEGAVEAARRYGARVVGAGDLPRADIEAPGLEGVRDAILGVPGPGGPVRRGP